MSATSSGVAKSGQANSDDGRSEAASTPHPVPNIPLVESTPPAPPETVAVEASPEPAETPGTVVLTIPVPGEDAPTLRKPFVTRLFKQWKRYNRGETVDWEDLDLKPLRLTKARTDSVRIAD